MDAADDIQAAQSATTPAAWEPPPLDLVVVESLEDEAQRSAAQKTDAELADLYAIALRAHADAAGSEGREGEADYWDVLQRAIVDESARRPEFGEQQSKDDEQRSRREQRRWRKRLEPLMAARAAQLTD